MHCKESAHHQGHAATLAFLGYYMSDTCQEVWHAGGLAENRDTIDIQRTALTLRFLYLLFGWPGALPPVLVARLLRMISMSASAVDLSVTSMYCDCPCWNEVVSRY